MYVAFILGGLFMKTDPKNYVLNNGLVKIPVASKLCILTYDQCIQPEWLAYGSYSKLAFIFTQPKGTKYFKLLKVFFDKNAPMRMSEAKRAVGIPANYWCQFTIAVKEFGFLRRIPGSWDYMMTPEGKQYVQEVLEGRCDFRLEGA